MKSKPVTDSEETQEVVMEEDEEDVVVGKETEVETALVVMDSSPVQARQLHEK